MKLLFVALAATAVIATADTPPETPRPLAAIAVSQCGGALALFIQLDATHLLRADPRQSDLFVAQPDGTMKQAHAAPMKWDEAYKLAQSAVITTHVVVPCTEGPTV